MFPIGSSMLGDLRLPAQRITSGFPPPEGQSAPLGSLGVLPGDYLFMAGTNAWALTQAYQQGGFSATNPQSGTTSMQLAAADLSITIAPTDNFYAFFVVYRNVSAIVQRVAPTSSSPASGFAKHPLHNGLLAMQYQNTAHQGSISVSPIFQLLGVAQNGNDGTSYGDRLYPENGFYTDNTPFTWSDPSLVGHGSLAIFEHRGFV